MDTITSVSTTTQTSEAELLSFLTEYATANDIALALWRLPDSSVKHLLLAHKTERLPKDTILENLPCGFIFSPFDRNQESVFLKGDFLFSFENHELKQPQTPLEAQSSAWLDEQLKHYQKSSGPKFRPNDKAVTPASEQDYLHLILTSISEIEKGTFEKVVPSRTKYIDLPAEFDVLNAFEKLCSRYSHAFVSFVSIPEVGAWLGASPEVLVCVEDKNIFKTVALAGTKHYEEGMNLRSVAWTQKEIEEQALVERYVISCFKKIRVREYDEHGPKTIVAGNLLHLRSDFTVDMKAINFPQLGSVMLQLLHPTSAVCGMPLDAALQFLKTNENYDRSFYSGYLGPVNVNNNISIFVNLRCMQLFDRKAALYAGAGVTIDSIPEDEFEETEMKFNTLLNVILH
jgi:isochorismate synthase